MRLHKLPIEFQSVKFEKQIIIAAKTRKQNTLVFHNQTFHTELVLKPLRWQNKAALLYRLKMDMKRDFF